MLWSTFIVIDVRVPIKIYVSAAMFGFVILFLVSMLFVTCGTCEKKNLGAKSVFYKLWYQSQKLALAHLNRLLKLE